MSVPEDPVLRNSRRETKVILVVWAASMVYCCVYCYLFGYIRDDRPLGLDDLNPILGIPSWFFWGVLVPWGVCGVFTIWFGAFYMTDDDLGSDHATELEKDIREEGEHHG